MFLKWCHTQNANPIKLCSCKKQSKKRKEIPDIKWIYELKEKKKYPETEGLTKQHNESAGGVGNKDGVALHIL